MSLSPAESALSITVIEWPPAPKSALTMTGPRAGSALRTYLTRSDPRRAVKARVMRMELQSWSAAKKNSLDWTFESRLVTASRYCCPVMRSLITLLDRLRIFAIKRAYSGVDAQASTVSGSSPGPSSRSSTRSASSRSSATRSAHRELPGRSDRNALHVKCSYPRIARQSSTCCASMACRVTTTFLSPDQ